MVALPTASQPIIRVEGLHRVYEAEGVRTPRCAA